METAYTIVVPDADVLSRLCGTNDSNLNLIEQYLGVPVFSCGNELSVAGSDPDITRQFRYIIDRLLDEVSSGSDVGPELLTSVLQPDAPGGLSGSHSDVAIMVPGAVKKIFPKTRHQTKLVQTMRRKDLVFCTGPAGSGKTFLMAAEALRMVLSREKKRLVLTRPVVEAGESLGFLPGDLEQKIHPYLRPLFDVINTLLPPSSARKLLESGVVEAAPLAYMRGRTLNDSVIILDEAQMLPAKYLIPCIWALSELICNYRCTVVLCTATQPSLEAYFPKGIQARELCPDVNEQYEFFRRTRLVYGGVFSEIELAEQLQEEEQVLCILNSRKRVQRIYRKLKREGVYHLSTLMYPNHRKRVLKEVRERLADGLPCCLIATSLVEAGVDLDFKTVYRELAGVDSVIQAAGRCNREGKRSREESLTVVFTMDKDEEADIPAELKQPIAVAEQIQREFEEISSLEAIHEYFERLYRYKGESLDSKEIVEQFEQGIRAFSFPFETAASKFHLIEERTKTLLVDKEPEARQITEQLRADCFSRDVMRQAGGYCIQVYDNLFEDLRGAGLIEELFPEFYRLRSAEQYKEDVGLLLNVSRGDAVFI